jgi:hypothetical protein
MTKGEERVRVSFNPSSNNTVDELKKAAAELIDMCEDLKDPQTSEKNRCLELAQTAVEDAAMWAVKGATAP